MSNTARSASLSEIVSYVDALLRHGAITDWPNAFNGLQMENNGQVTRIGAAVDACEATLRMAAERGIDFLLVHHGMLWNGGQPITGPCYRKFKLALDSNIALYSSHLPLDLHPEFGNNALLSKSLGLTDVEPFLMEKGQFIGWKAKLAVDRDDLAERLHLVVGGPVKLIAGGPRQTATVGIVSGGAGGELKAAAAEGVDTFITGEGSHWTYLMAEELGLNLLYAGHYATETFGVRAVADHLSKRYNLPWEFLDHPTGL